MNSIVCFVLVKDARGIQPHLCLLEQTHHIHSVYVDIITV